MSYIDENENPFKENRFLIEVMISYIEDYEFLYQCIGYDTSRVVIDIEQIVIDLVDLQGDCVYYTPLSIA